MGQSRVLVTGHKGFIGAWTVQLLCQAGWTVFGLDDESSYGERLYDMAGMKSMLAGELTSDVSDLQMTQAWIEQIGPELIIHLAGQAIVPRAFKQPYLTFKSNALGTLAILEAARLTPCVRAVMCITSDKVYENNNNGQAFSETDMLGGSDIYSVSKSGSELIAKAYNVSHCGNGSPNIQTIRLGNVVGGGDWAVNRLIPDLIHAARSGGDFRVRYMDATRPFQHVSDVVSGISKIASAALNGRLRSGEAWNLGPRNNSFAKVRDVIDLFKRYYPNLSVIDSEEKIKEDLNLRVDVAKYSDQFSPPVFDSMEGVERAIRWYQSFYAGTSPIDLVRADLSLLG